MGINEGLFFPKTGDYYCESASKAYGGEFILKLYRMGAKESLKLQKELASLSIEEDSDDKTNVDKLEKQLEGTLGILKKIVVGWNVSVEFNDENLDALMEELPLDSIMDISVAAVNYARTGILEDKRSKNEESSPN